MRKKTDPAPRSALRFNEAKEWPGHHEKMMRKWGERDRNWRKARRRRELAGADVVPAASPLRFRFVAAPGKSPAEKPASNGNRTRLSALKGPRPSR